MQRKLELNIKNHLIISLSKLTNHKTHPKRNYKPHYAEGSVAATAMPVRHDSAYSTTHDLQRNNVASGYGEHVLLCLTLITQT